jgi:hypothetical protein
LVYIYKGSHTISSFSGCSSPRFRFLSTINNRVKGI